MKKTVVYLLPTIMIAIVQLVFSTVSGAAQEYPERQEFKQLVATGRMDEAENLIRRLVSTTEANIGTYSEGMLPYLDDLTQIQKIRGTLSDAQDTAERTLIIRGKTIGKKHTHYGINLIVIGEIMMMRDLTEDSVRRFEEAKAIFDSADPPVHRWDAIAYYFLGKANADLNRTHEAENFLKRAVSIFNIMTPPVKDYPYKALMALGSVYGIQDKYRQASDCFQRAFNLARETVGEGSWALASAAEALGHTLMYDGRYKEAEPMLNAKLAYELGREKTDVAALSEAYLGVGKWHNKQGRVQEAVILLEKASSLLESVGGGHEDIQAEVARELSLSYSEVGRLDLAEEQVDKAIRLKGRVPDYLLILADIRSSQGKLMEAEDLFINAISAREKKYGQDHAMTGYALSSLGYYYSYTLGDSAAALPIITRAKKILDSTIGHDHPDALTVTGNLALVNDLEGNSEQALNLAEEAARGMQDYPQYTNALRTLALIFNSQGRHEEAIHMIKTALENGQASEETLAIEKVQLASVYEEQKRLQEAVPLLQEALATLTPHYKNRRLIAMIYDLLMQASEAANDIAMALEYARKSGNIRHELFFHDEYEGYDDVISRKGSWLSAVSKIELLTRVAVRDPERAQECAAEAFEEAQIAHFGMGGRIFEHVGTRLLLQDKQAAELMREGVQLTIRRDELRELALSQATKEGPEEKTLADLSKINGDINRIEDTLRQRYPRLEGLLKSRATEVSEVQRRLNKDEALLFIFSGSEKMMADGIYAWVITTDKITMHNMNVTAEDVSMSVKRVVDSLQVTDGRVQPFNVQESYLLYKEVVAPLEKDLNGAKKVIVVPGSALEKIPLAVLVTEEPRNVLHPGDYRNVAWFGFKFALTTFPSVGAFRAAREMKSPEGKRKPFVGFGAPLLEGGTYCARQERPSQNLMRGGRGDVEAIRRLCPLPESATELRTLALAAGGNQSNIFVGKEATEERLRRMDLTQYRIIAFATHAVAGRIGGRIMDPSIVLTPPAQLSQTDDGLLTGAEIADLRLDADLVILSACNTAIGTAATNEQWTGLALPFIYAGAKATLISYWSIPSLVAQTLTTTFLSKYQQGKMGRAEALQAAMFSVMNDSQHISYAHPSFWAPFAIMGDGA